MTRRHAHAAATHLMEVLNVPLSAAEDGGDPVGCWLVGFDVGLRAALESPAAAKRIIAALDEAFAVHAGPEAVQPLAAVGDLVAAFTPAPAKVVIQ